MFGLERNHNMWKSLCKLALLNHTLFTDNERVGLKLSTWPGKRLSVLKRRLQFVYSKRFLSPASYYGAI